VKKAKKLGVQEKDFSKLQKGKTLKIGKIKVKQKQVIGPERPGKAIVFSGDTGYSKSLIEFSGKVDLLIHEATYGDEMREWAKKVKHCTNVQAAEVAKKAKVKQLVLNHISPRYKETSNLEKQAKKVFKNTKIAIDFLEVKI
jgi:ribonuclease Z